ncbi:MAG: hypothetical protein V4689_06755 [Verrucomicrobiota bacterium]
MKTICLGIGALLLLAVVGCKKSDVMSSEPRPIPARMSDPPPLAELGGPHAAPRLPKTARTEPKIGTLEEGFKTSWTKISVAFAADDGCTGLQRQHELVISRKDDKMTIQGSERVSYDKTVETPERSLDMLEFDEIVKKLGEFQQAANRELDVGEHFSALPREERLREMEAYEQEHGSRYGGFGGVYFFVQFDTLKPDVVVKSAFTESKSVEDYIEWIRLMRASCWATIGI